MATPIKSNDNKRILIAGAWVLTGVVAFAVGRGSVWLEAPITPAPVVTTSAGTSASSPGVNADGSPRVGGVFSTESAGKTGAAPTVGEVTGGQPLEDWLKRVMAQEDELFRMQNFMKLLESLNTPEDVETALKVVMAGGGRGRGPGGGPRFTEISMLMAKFVQLDAKGAMEFAGKQEGGEKFMATSSALRTWTRLSPDAALAWASTEGAKLTMDFGGRGGPGGGQDQADAPKDNFALLSVVSQLAKTDLDKALSTASTMELGRMGDRMVETVANEMMSQRGADAARSYADSLPAGAFRDSYIQQISEKLAGADPAGTASWVSKLESGDVKRRSLGRVVDQWANKDVSAATAYVTNLPVGTDSDSARGEIVNRLTKTDPKSALNLSLTITDPERQARSAVMSGHALLIADPTNGPAVIAATNLPEPVKNQAMTPPKQGQGGPGGGGNFRTFSGGGRPR